MTSLTNSDAFKKELFSNDSYSTLFTFLKRLISAFEDEKLKKFALSYVPVKQIEKNTQRKLSTYDVVDPFVTEMVFLKELVRWFKTDFYRWMDTPSCDKCKIRMTFKEKVNSVNRCLISTFVELYKCNSCGATDFLNRFVDPRILFITREGRCSEFALCFTLICLSLGMRARYVYDMTDHCWTEVYSPVRHQWIHVDPSEGIVDSPLIYELGWKKVLSYIFSFGVSDIQDVTWRYSTNHKQILARRTLSQSTHITNEIIRHRNAALSKVPESKKRSELLLVIEELAALLLEPIPIGTYGSRQSGVLNNTYMSAATSSEQERPTTS